MGNDFRNEARKAQALYVGGLGAGMAAEGQMVPEQYGGEDRAVQEPLSIRIERRLSAISTDGERLLRVKSILEQHPEFELFIEFNELLNRARLR